MQYIPFHASPCPSDVLFKHLCSSGKINTILSEVYIDLQKKKESKDTFLVRCRKCIKEDVEFREEVFQTWVTNKVQKYLELKVRSMKDNWNFFDLLFFHLLGIAYNAPPMSYPEEALCIKNTNKKDVAIYFAEPYQRNFIVLIEGIAALSEMREITQKWKASFSEQFKKIVCRYKEFLTIASILEAKTELLQLFEKDYADVERTRLLQQSFVKLSTACKISLPEDFFSRDMDSYMAAIDRDGEACSESIHSFLGKSSLKDYTTDFIRGLLDYFSPPLRERDKNAIDAELEKADAEKISLEDTCIVRIILPVLNGEKFLSDEDEIFLGDEFSANFVRDLKLGVMHIENELQEEGKKVSPDCAEYNESISTLPSEFPSSKVLPAQLADEEHNFLDSVLTEESVTPLNSEEQPGEPPMGKITDTFPVEGLKPGDAEGIAEVAPHVAIDAPALNEGGKLKEVNAFDSDAREMEATETLLTTKRTCELYWLMREKPRSDIPIWLAELLYLGTRLQPGFTASQNRIKELIEEGEVYYGQTESFSENLSMLLAASLIRPVLMMPAITHKSLLDKLVEPLGSYRCEPLLTGLGTFAARGKALDDAVFKGLSLMAQRQKHQEELERRTRDLLDATLYKKINFQRATAVVKELFSPRGELGIVLHACLNGDYSHLVSNIKKDWTNKAFLSKIVNELDVLVNKPTKSARKINYMAFDAIMRDVATAKQLLTSWHTLVQQSTTTSHADFSHKQLNDIVAQAHPESLPDTPYASFFKEQLEELQLKFSTSIARESAVDPLAELMIWPVNLKDAEPLPEGFQVSLAELLKYIELDPAENVRQVNQSLFSHIISGHFTAVEQFLTVFPSYRTNELTGARDEQIKRWAATFSECVDKVEREIGDAYLRGVIQESQENDLSSEIAGIVNSYEQGSLDAFLAIKHLEKIRNQLCSQEEHHKNELQARLDEVANTIPEENLHSIKMLIELVPT